MAYIGVSPSNGVRRVHTYTATASQTTFSGAGAEGTSLSYKDSNFVDVYQNGVKLGDADYTATSGTSIVLGTGATASDIVVIVVFDVFSVADTVSKADGGTFDGNVTMAGTLGVTGVLTGTSLDISGDIDVDGTTNLDVVDIDGAVDMASTLTVTGASILNGGIDIAGDFTLDVGGGDISIKDDGTTMMNIGIENSDVIFNAQVSNKDIIFKGTDDGSSITALTLDMSEAGAATFNSSISVANTVAIASSNTSAFMQASDNVFQFGTSSADPVVFLADNSERMRIDTSGRVAMGTTDSTFTNLARLVSASNLASFHTAVFQNTTNNTGGLFLRMMNHAGQDCGSISQSGTTSVNYASSSDYRLKENIKYDFNGISKLKQLKPCEFNFIADDTDSTQAGFIAHEVQDVVPLAVTGKKDEMETYTDDDGKEQKRPRYQGVDNTKIVPLLTKALQEALTRIDTLEAEVKALKG